MVNFENLGTEEHRIINADCLEYLMTLPDESVHLVVTDPPYGLGKDIENDDLSREDFIKFLALRFSQIKRVIKPKHSIICFFDNGKKMPIVFDAIKESGLFFQKQGTWYKPDDCSMPHNRTLRTSEAFLILSSTPELNHSGDKFIHDTLIFNRGFSDKSFWHPTVKSVLVIRELILANSKTGWTVLDPFLGSGTTLVACKMLGRKGIGIEIDKGYCEIARKRLLNVPKKLEGFFD